MPESDKERSADLRLCKEDFDGFIILERHATHLNHRGFKQSFEAFRQRLIGELLDNGQYVFPVSPDGSKDFEELLRGSGVRPTDVDRLVTEENFPIRTRDAVIRNAVVMTPRMFDQEMACLFAGWKHAAIEDLFVSIPILSAVSRQPFVFPVLAMGSRLSSRDGAVCVAVKWEADDRSVYRAKLVLETIPTQQNTNRNFLMVSEDRD